ncbi:MAG: 6-phosphogluconate dehydrogenase, partial [Actinomycetota bacterium]|nr:6-phosphogluconate dehydrogenase [Actinomycetota bacterium]
MQAYGEGYEVLDAVELDIDVSAAIDVWRHGSVVRSWLLDL